jgi:hypothetical protein
MADNNTKAEHGGARRALLRSAVIAGVDALAVYDLDRDWQNMIREIGREGEMAA